MERVEQIPEIPEYSPQPSSYPPPTKTSISLKRPKRTMSAYACYSRKVYVIDFQ